MMLPRSERDLREVPLTVLDERLSRYRLQSSLAIQQMAQSLQQYGQMAPVVVYQADQNLILIDGFKRLQAARRLKGFDHLLARCLEVDEAAAKAAIYRLNQLHGRPQQLEEAWIVHALVRDDGLSQVEAGHLLGRHKSWVNRRLALLEQLAPAVLDELRLGLLSVALARQLVRLPMGNQNDALTTAREASLTSVELRGVVDLLLASSTNEQRQMVLQDPRRALRQAESGFVHVWDPRLSAAGNRAAKQLGQLLDGLARMDSWLRYRGRADLVACDRPVLTSGFERLVKETLQVHEAAQDFLKELQLP
jgi:ParB-like chromosome segregation protein Spo0J